MTIPYYIGEDRSDMRGIKPGWYAIEDDAASPPDLLEECVARITQPTIARMAPKSHHRPS